MGEKEIVTITIYWIGFNAVRMLLSEEFVALKSEIAPISSMTIYLGIQLKFKKSTNALLRIPVGIL